MLRARLLQLAWWAGLWRPPDRVMLEDVILPHCAAAAGPVLFVGVRFYTRHYAALCHPAPFHTLDRDPAMARYGAPGHLTGSVEHLDRYHPAPYFHAIILNGVLGWGLDDPATADRALAACHAALEPDGLLVLGINETRPQTPALAGLPALRRFVAREFPPLRAARVVVPTPFAERSHTYLFFRASREPTP